MFLCSWLVELTNCFHSSEDGYDTHTHNHLRKGAITYLYSMDIPDVPKKPPYCRRDSSLTRRTILLYWLYGVKPLFKMTERLAPREAFPLTEDMARRWCKKKKPRSNRHQNLSGCRSIQSLLVAKIHRSAAKADQISSRQVKYHQKAGIITNQRRQSMSHFHRHKLCTLVMP